MHRSNSQPYPEGGTAKERSITVGTTTDGEHEYKGKYCLAAKRLPYIQLRAHRGKSKVAVGLTWSYARNRIKSIRWSVDNYVFVAYSHKEWQKNISSFNIP